MSRYSLLGILFLSACGQESRASKELEKESFPKISVDSNTIYSLSGQTINRLDSAYRLTRNPILLSKIDSIACLSDGDLSEQIAVVAFDMYSTDSNGFFKTAYAKKLHCLENALVMGISEELAVYHGLEREKELELIRRTANKTLTQLSAQERVYAEKLLAQIKPELFD